MSTINNTPVSVDLLKYYDEKLKAYEKAITDAIEGKADTLIGDDSNKSARAIAAEELAKQLIPENAKESLDTLNEIAAWIQSHPDDATSMNTAIGKLQAIVAGIGGDEDDYKSVTAYVAAQVNALNISNYYTKSEADEKFVAQETDKSLMTADEHTKLEGVQAEATKTTISADFTSGIKVAGVTVNGTTTDVYVPVGTKADIDAMFAAPAGE